MGKATQQAVSDAGKRLAMLADEDGPAAEAYRTLRTVLRFNPALGMGSGGGGRAVLLADAGGVPERAHAVANLGVAFARVGERTVLVDANLRPPAAGETTLSALFGQADATVGLGAAVQGPESGRKVLLPLVETEIPGLLLLPVGPRVANPADLLGADAFAALVAALRAEAEVVLFDAPPVVAYADARAVAARVDGTLLLVAQDTTRRPQAQAALAALRQVGATVLGVVLTEARE